MDDVHAGMMAEQVSAVLLFLLAMAILLAQERWLARGIQVTTERILREPVLTITEGELQDAGI